MVTTLDYQTIFKMHLLIWSRSERVFDYALITLIYNVYNRLNIPFSERKLCYFNGDEDTRGINIMPPPPPLPPPPPPPPPPEVIEIVEDDIEIEEELVVIDADDEEDLFIEEESNPDPFMVVEQMLYFHV